MRNGSRTFTKRRSESQTAGRPGRLPCIQKRPGSNMLPHRTGCVGIGVGAVWPAAGGAGALQGRLRGLRFRGGNARMPFEFPCDPLIERGLLSSGRSQSQRLCNSVSMRVQVPPSRCRSARVSPRSATGPHRPEAGRKSGAWKPQSGYPVSQVSMGSAREGCVGGWTNLVVEPS